MYPATHGKWTSGADPEMFCRNDSGLVAVQNVGVVTGTKEEPQALPLGSNVQRDNAAIEFAVPPATSKEEFVQFIGDALSDVLDLLPEGVSVDITPSANFPNDQLTHEECKQFGCDPDMNAWTMKVNEPPTDAAENDFRSCGGHIHVGFVQGSGNDFLKDIDGKAMTIRMMDCFHGIAATILDSSQAAVDRRKLYGKPGCFRPTEYGVEYRTLSNFWIQSPVLVELMYSLTDDVLKVMRDKKFMEIIGNLNAKNIQRIIIEGDTDTALKIFTGYLNDFLGEDSIVLFWECYSKIDADINYKEEWKEML